MYIKKIGIVSLSRGILGESFVNHEVEIGIDRLHSYGLSVEFMPHSKDGIEALENHPEYRASDLIEAFKDESIDMIFCAIGGLDTYKTLPFLMENEDFKKVFSKKVFLGFSDTTINHFMFNRLGLGTFYGQAFLPDVCELSNDMLDYTKKYFLELIETGRISKIKPSKYWYKERVDFSKKGIGVDMEKSEDRGFELLRGSSVFRGKILGGCIESIYCNFLDCSREKDSVEICNRYNIFPKKEEWKGKILLLESSETKSSPELYRKMVKKLNDYGIFDFVSGVLIGKPQDEVYYDEYKEILIEEIKNKEIPIMYNINIGHATPRCIIPFGVEAIVDYEKQEIEFIY